MEFKCPDCGHVLNDYEVNHCWCTNCNRKFSSSEEIKSLNEEWAEEQKRLADIEHDRQDYAMRRLGLYEYDIETVINENHGTVDKDRMRQILNERAKQGWKLHTMYSNELGKNALGLLGLGINSTACEDVMVFERKLQDSELQ